MRDRVFPSSLAGSDRSLAEVVRTRAWRLRQTANMKLQRPLRSTVGLSVLAALTLVGPGCGDDDDTNNLGSAESGTAADDSASTTASTDATDADDATAGSSTTDQTAATDGSTTDDSTTDGSTTDGSGDTGPGALYEVAGVFGRDASTTIWEGNDGVGNVYLVALSACEEGATELGFATIEEADLADATARIPFVMSEIPEGEIYISGFLDDNGNADSEAPGPDIGDIVMAAGVMMGCANVTLDGDVSEQEVLLNFTLPF